MNKKLFLTSAGCASLAAAVIAFPGLSAQTPPPAPEQSQTFVIERDPEVFVSNDPAELAAGPEWAMASEDDPTGDKDVHIILAGSSWLGVETSEVTAANVKEWKLPAERGVAIGKVVPDSPAAKAGLKANDVITDVNGQRIEGTAQFRRVIREIPSGRTVQLTVWRDGHSQSVTATLGKSEMTKRTQVFATPMPGSFMVQTPEMPEMPPMPALGEGGSFRITTSGKPRLGIDAEDLNGELGNYFGAPDGEGVLVRGVFPDSPAAKAGLKAGDVITTIDGERTTSVAKLRETLRGSSDAKTYKLGLLRNKAAMTLSVEIPAPETPQKMKMKASSLRTNI